MTVPTAIIICFFAIFGYFEFRFLIDKYMRQSKINMENVDANVQRLSDNLQYQKDQLLMKVQAMSDVMVDGITADSHDFVKLHVRNNRWISLH